MRAGLRKKNKSEELTRFLKYFLWPFSIVYASIMALRNWLFDRQWLLISKIYEKPVICIGNLSVGGTGKTPMVEYLIRMLAGRHQLAVLSRGYGRNTKGYIALSDVSSAETVGDEPFQLYQKFGDQVGFYVCEKRVDGLDRIFDESSTQIVLLDDAFQHRYVKAKIYVLLTAYDHLFVSDMVLPAGRLREHRSGAKRADIVVITKCPPDLDVQNQNKIKKDIQKYTKSGTPVFFSRIIYDQVCVVNGFLAQGQNIVLLSGIANPQPLIAHVSANYKLNKSLQYPDHHAFTSLEIDEIVAFCKSVSDSFLLTTEKDFQRLIPFKDRLHDIALGYIPIKFDFYGDEIEFEQKLNYLLGA